MSPPAAATLKQQTSVLSGRYAMCFWGDAKSLLLLIGQAPLIGYFCALVWGGIETDTPMLRFVLCLSAHWFGLINACREIVKEREIFERERIFGLSPTAFVFSKVTVLAFISFIQVALLLAAVQWRLDLRGALPIQFLILWAAAFSGIGLGLLVSSFVNSQERAVFAVPLLVLPQILFSELAVPKETFLDAVKVIEKLMPTRWGYHAFEHTAAKEVPWLDLLGAGVVQLLFGAAFVGASIFALLRRPS